MMRQNTRRQQGFTIIELLVATSVLSVILLLVTAMMISIGNLFYKGVNQSHTQQSVRDITDQISQNLELTGSDRQHFQVAGDPVQAYCVGNTRYSYILGTKIGNHRPTISNPIYQHVLWQDTTADSSCSAHADLTLVTPSAGGQELIAPNSRLINLQITGNGPYEVEVFEAYGDDDLLCDSSSTCSGATGMAYPDYTNDNVTCAGHVGDQFCATARLNTTVGKRLAN
jgi:prepilin-type N-terminal cleavage/methylation domain-containing protein